MKDKEDTLTNKYLLDGSLSGTADFTVITSLLIREFLIKSRMNPVVISTLSQINPCAKKSALPKAYVYVSSVSS